MLPHLATILLLPLGALAAAVHHHPLPPALSRRDVSPDNTCGEENSGYTCPGEAACCSQHGFCGSTDEFCLTTAQCQPDFSNSTAACHAPVPGESISIDGTCGTTEAGTEGYRCPGNATVTSCCSAA
ncbi:carbohydrate-binding module family 18 protein [Chaetomium sp. MPI-CAGE-AT-0009]|nr:carbohydrate-binding module family 18 protein [Chaetomium sp. MPI-CAGE-AT-0009]